MDNDLAKTINLIVTHVMFLIRWDDTSQITYVMI